MTTLWDFVGVALAGLLVSLLVASLILALRSLVVSLIYALCRHEWGEPDEHVWYKSTITEHYGDSLPLDVDRLAPLLGREFGKAGFFAPSASMEFLTNQARRMLEDIARQ